MGGDPLTAVRTLSQHCKRKLERALAENRVIETSMCQRAIDKLNEVSVFSNHNVFVSKNGFAEDSKKRSKQNICRYVTDT